MEEKRKYKAQRVHIRHGEFVGVMKNGGCALHYLGSMLVTSDWGQWGSEKKF